MTSMYTIIQRLGKGSFGYVYLLQVPNGDTYALKVANVPQMGSKEKDAEKEGRLMVDLRHPHIVQACSFFLHKHCLYLVMEFCHGGSLDDHLKQIHGLVPESQVLFWLCQMADGLRYLHAKKVVHRDIKPANIFLNNKMNIKIGDLGIARQFEVTDERLKSVAGTFSYMSPELIERTSHTTKTDIWSLGCTVYEMMMQKRPFESLKAIIMCDPKSLPMSKDYSKDLQDLVQKMLEVKDNKRPDANDVLFYSCSIRKMRFIPVTHMEMGSVEFDKEELIKAVEHFDCPPEKGESQEQKGGRKKKVSVLKRLSAQSSQDSDASSSAGSTIRSSESSTGRSFSYSADISGTEESGFGTGTWTTKGEGSTVKYMDSLATECLQSLRRKYRSLETGLGESMSSTLGGSTFDSGTLSDNDSIVTLYTRAQKAVYKNKRRNRSRSRGTGQVTG